MDLAVLIAIVSKKKKVFLCAFFARWCFFSRKRVFSAFFHQNVFFSIMMGKIIVNTAISLQFEIYLPCFTPHIILPVQRIVCCFKPVCYYTDLILCNQQIQQSDWFRRLTVMGWNCRLKMYV